MCSIEKGLNGGNLKSHYPDYRVQAFTRLKEYWGPKCLWPIQNKARGRFSFVARTYIHQK